MGEKNKYYVGVDCEGVACVVGTPGEGLMDDQNYTFARHQATLEANAAAKALFDMGAEEVIIWDNHYNGKNLDYYLLDSRCKIALGSGHKGRFPLIDETFGGVLFIGYHARDNTRESTLAHTFCSDTYQYFKLNGVEVGEMQIDAAFAGLYNVPVLFASSDDKAIEQAKESFKNIETVVTKQSLSWTSAMSLHPQTVCQKIYDGVCNAVKNKNIMEPYILSNPLNVEIRYKRLDGASCAQLFDLNGKPFEFLDPFTRFGTMKSIEDLF